MIFALVPEREDHEAAILGVIFAFIRERKVKKRPSVAALLMKLM